MATVVVPVLSIRVVASNDRTLLRAWIKLLATLLLFVPAQLLFCKLYLGDLFWLLFTAWLCLPYSQGYSIVFNQFLAPFLSTPVEASQPAIRLVFEQTVDWLLQAWHEAAIKVLSKVAHCEKLTKLIQPLLWVIDWYYDHLLSVQSNIKRLRKKYLKKLVKLDNGTLADNVVPQAAINDFFSDLNNYKESPKRSKSPEKKNTGKTTAEKLLKTNRKDQVVKSMLNQNFYIEYFFSQYKENPSSLLILNLALSIIIFAFSACSNYIVLLLYKATGIKQEEPKAEKKVSFVERALSFSSLKAPSTETAKEKDIPVIQLTPASPTFPSGSMLVGSIRKHSKSVGADSKPNSFFGGAGRKRRNSFKEFLKGTRYSFSSQLRLSNYNSADCVNTDSIAEAAAAATLNVISPRSRSSTRGNSTFLEFPSKVSTIEEHESSNLAESHNNSFIKSKVHHDSLLPLKTSSNLSLSKLADELSKPQDGLSRPLDEPSKPQEIASPVTITSTDNVNDEMFPIVGSDPFSAILNDSSEKKKVVSSEKRKSFMLFRKPHGESNGIDINLASPVESSRVSLDSGNTSNHHNSWIDLIKNASFRSSSPASVGRKSDIKSVSKDNVENIAKDSVDTKHETTIKDVNKDAYDKLTGVFTSGNNNYPVAKKNHPHSNDISEATTHVLRTSSQMTASLSTNEELPSKLNSHQSQHSTGSFGVKFVHSFTPNLRKVESHKITEVSDLDSIDYLTYQHPLLRLVDDTTNGSQPYMKLPLHFTDDDGDNDGETKLQNGHDKHVLLMKRKALKTRLKKISVGSSKSMKSTSVSPERSTTRHHHHSISVKEKSTKIFKHRNNSYTSFADEPCTY